MGYFERIDPGGWTAVQVSNFMEKINRYGSMYQVSELLDQTDSIDVCKGIIVRLVKDNQNLRNQKRRNQGGN